MAEELQAISIDKDDVPYEFDIELGGTMYTFLVKYNDLMDVFTVDLFKEDGAPLVYGEPLIYGRPLFDALSSVELPSVQLIPFDVADKEDRVSYDNMNETVFLYVIEGDSENE